MKQICKILILFFVFFTTGCVEIDSYHRLPSKEVKYGADVTLEEKEFLVPECENKTTVVVYDEQGQYEVPACSDFVTTETSQEFMTKEFNPDEIEGEFPDVENNKYFRNQVVLQDPNTRILAYCRGPEEAVEKCVKRLENSCYVRLSNIPRMSAKYDTLKRGVYPSRRWRSGENVPRW